uniref:Ribonuclease HII n=1 Tax=uncultured bacterium contig00064 TaxID=1181547 RepID=A0A806JZP4_9BACT|nr:ribonuclease HII [uncultured bacterium contig00064]
MSITCGIDEAGRGPLAGPVYAAAVILNKDFPRGLLNDSKKLSEAKREDLRRLICENATAWGIASASHEEIDKINILQASLLAMKRAFEEMIKMATQKQTLPQNENISVIVDGNKVPSLSACGGFSVSCEAVVKADAKIHEVMAASILAKTARDAYMDEMAKLYPVYGYEKHKGYPTKAHRQAVLKYGPSPIQRLTFTVK